MAYSQDFWKDSKLVLRDVTEFEDGKKKYEYLWSVENYDKTSIGIIYHSQPLIIGKDTHNLCLQRIKQNVAAGNDKFMVQIILEHISIVKDNIVTCFSILDHSKKIHSCLQPDGGYFAINEEPYLTINARLQVLFSITLSTEEAISICNDISISELQNYIYLAEDVGELFVGGKYTDVKVIVGECEFNAHRCILASRSLVLEQMLNESKKKALNYIEIKDCSGEVFYEFLRYLYSGNLKTYLEESVMKLIELGHIYGVAQLKIDAADILAHNTTLSNATSILKLSHTFDLPNLKASTVDFITKNLGPFSVNPDWHVVVSECSLKEIVRKSIVENVSSCTDYRPDFSDDKWVKMAVDLNKFREIIAEIPSDSTGSESSENVNEGLGNVSNDLCPTVSGSMKDGSINSTEVVPDKSR